MWNAPPWIGPARQPSPQSWWSWPAAPTRKFGRNGTNAWRKILGAPFLSRFGGRTINTHPALLPAFPGAHAVRDALAYGVKVTGSTVHFVDAGVDTGPIIAQEPVAIMPGESESDLHERIKQVERKLIVNVLNSATVAADNQGEVDFANHE